MIISKTVWLKPSGRAISYFKNLGYDARWHEDLEVKVEDLQPNSSAYIDVQCDNKDCQHIHRMLYSRYTKNIRSNNGMYYCNDCWQQRLEQKIFETYGVTNVSYLPEIQNKKMETSMKNYGVPYPNMSEEFRKQCEDRREEKYGYRKIKISQESIQRRKQTCLERYGYANPLQVPEFKEKAFDTNEKKYGTKYISQAESVKAKRAQTMWKNDTTCTSRQQRYIHSLYGGELNYPVTRSYMGDIVFVEERLICEVDFGGHNLPVKLGQMTQEEFDKKEIVRNKIIKRAGYQTIHLISHTDKLPSDSKLLEILDFSRQYFKDYPNHSWIEWHIDNGLYKNAEHKDGVPYDFGELRRIRKEDIA